MSVQEQFTEHKIGQITFNNTIYKVKITLHQSPKGFEDEWGLISKRSQVQIVEYRGHIYAVSWGSTDGIGVLEADFNPSTSSAIWQTCQLFDRWRGDKDLSKDKNLRIIWYGFENSLKSQTQHLHRMLAPATNPSYDLREWQVFLEETGYQPRGNYFFEKRLI